jgi:hypothetical protein
MIHDDYMKIAKIIRKVRRLTWKDKEFANEVCDEFARKLAEMYARDCEPLEVFLTASN